MLGFINKDVLSVKIVSAAKQHTAQESKVVVLLLPADTLEGNGTAEGTGMSPQGLFHLSLSAGVICSSTSRGSGGGGAFRPFQPSDNRGWCVCQLSSAPMCRQRGVFVGWGRGREDESRKTRRLKSTITLFLSLTTSNVKTILTRPVKTTRWGSITARGHFVFLITFVSLSSFPLFEKCFRFPTWISHYLQKCVFLKFSALYGEWQSQNVLYRKVKSIAEKNVEPLVFVLKSEKERGEISSQTIY